MRAFDILQADHLQQSNSADYIKEQSVEDSDESLTNNVNAFQRAISSRSQGIGALM